MTDTLASALWIYHTGQGHLHTGIVFEDLRVDGSNDVWWNSECAKVLLVLCNHYKIKKLDFFFLGQGHYPWDTTFLPKVLPTSFCLTTIRIRYDGTNFPKHLKILFDRTKVHTIVCVLPKATWISMSERFISFFRNIEENDLLADNYSVKRIKFQKLDGSDCGHKWPDDECGEMNRMIAILFRNQCSFRKCQKACIIFLAPRLKKERRIDPNVCKLIASMIWETVGTKVW